MQATLLPQYTYKNTCQDGLSEWNIRASFLPSHLTEEYENATNWAWDRPAPTTSLTWGETLQFSAWHASCQHIGPNLQSLESFVLGITCSITMWSASTSSPLELKGSFFFIQGTVSVQPGTLHNGLVLGAPATEPTGILKSFPSSSSVWGVVSNIKSVVGELRTCFCQPAVSKWSFLPFCDWPHEAWLISTGLSAHPEWYSPHEFFIWWMFPVSWLLVLDKGRFLKRGKWFLGLN